MLRKLNQNQAFFVALLAQAARIRRDELLRNVPEDALSDTKSSRGEHNPAASFGFEPLPPDAEQLILRRQHPQQKPTPRLRGGDAEFLAWCERAPRPTDQKARRGLLSTAM